MREATRLIAFILLIIGTLGLITNEFIFDWGSSATLTFAVINFVGLVVLAFSFWVARE
ncbi:hypothetical protein ACFLYF_00885 [Chloroflexota bacterium]